MSSGQQMINSNKNNRTLARNVFRKFKQGISASSFPFGSNQPFQFKDPDPAEVRQVRKLIHRQRKIEQLFGLVVGVAGLGLMWYFISIFFT